MPCPVAFLQKEAVAAENSCAERLLEADTDLNLRRGAEESVAVDHVFVSRSNFDGTMWREVSSRRQAHRRRQSRDIRS